jgi:hypothetical protein
MVSHKKAGPVTRVQASAPPQNSLHACMCVAPCVWMGGGLGPGAVGSVAGDTEELGVRSTGVGATDLVGLTWLCSPTQAPLPHDAAWQVWKGLMQQLLPVCWSLC